MNQVFTAILCCIATLGSVSAKNLNVDKTKSRIHVDAKATGHSFTGTLQDYTATVSGNTTELKPTAFSLAWDFTNLKTGEKKRDRKMIDWLGGGNPKGTFSFTKSWKKDGKNYAMGKITIKGVSKTITFPYTVKKEGNWITIDGIASLDYEDFKLPIIRTAAIMTVNPKLKVRFHIVGEL